MDCIDLARVRTTAAALVLIVIGLAVSTKNLSQEAAVSLQGDMPRYLMNGVYFHDVIKDQPWRRLLDYTREYYARYPALSIGHHPVLLPLAESAAFSVAGISVRSARGVIILSLIACALGMFALLRTVYGDWLAMVSSLLLITSPIIVGFSRVVLSEMLTVTLVVMSVLAYHRYCERGTRLWLTAFVAAVAASMYARQLAVFMLPIFCLHFVMTQGVRRVLARDVLVAAAAICLVAVPLAALTLKLSPYNVSLIVTPGHGEAVGHFEHLRVVILNQFSVPALVLSATGMLITLYRRDGRALFYALWIVLMYLQLHYITKAIDPVRYAILWTPAFCFFAGTVVDGARHTTIRAALTVLLVATVGYQTVKAINAPTESAGGYEEAARFVVDRPLGSSVLFSGDVDTGYFVFFVRKYDPSRHLVVLRSDKLFTTSMMQQVAFRDRIRTRDEIFQNLRDFGTGYVVVEDAPSSSQVLEGLRQELKSTLFVERKRIPIQTQDRRLMGFDLVVYEYRERTEPRADAVLRLDMPVVNQSVDLPFGALVTPQAVP